MLAARVEEQVEQLAAEGARPATVVLGTTVLANALPTNPGVLSNPDVPAMLGPTILAATIPPDAVVLAPASFWAVAVARAATPGEH